jgi:hypothetical protein
MTEEEWRPVPGFAGSYEVSNLGRVRGLHRIVTRRNNVKYTAQPRILHLKRHPVSGLLTVALARRGQYTYLYVHRLVQAVFGDQAAA